MTQDEPSPEDWPAERPAESIAAAPRDPGDLAVPRRVAPAAGPALAACDRLCRVATLALGVPVALVALVDADRPAFAGAAGLPDALAAARDSPLAHSFCRRVVAAKAPLVVGDARRTAPAPDNPAAGRGVVAFAGMPLVAADGRALGALCAIDRKPRCWSERDRAILADLAAAAVREIESGAHEAALAQHARLLDQAYDAIFAWAWVGPITFWNRGAERLYGYPAEEAVGRVSHDLLRTLHPETTREFLRDLERDGLWEGRLRHRHGDGRTLTVDSRQLLLREASGWVVLEINRDATAREQAEEERTAFLGALAHDVKNPLGAVKGHAQLMRPRLRRGADPERLEASLDGIEGSVERAAALIDAMLDAARLGAGQPLELRLAPTDLVDLAREGIAEAQRATTAHWLLLEAAEPTLVGAWDRLRLERVIANLLSNAVKYSPGGGEVVVRVARVEAAGAAWAELSVRDQGLGIPAADQATLFERFRRGHNVGAIGGAGIGLSGVRQIVAQHGGTLSVESEEGRGSTFTVRLPLDAG